jgi:ankyrin repeat protein
LISKTQMLLLVKNLKWKDVAEGLAENPKLLAFRDERGRNWLHLCCAVKIKERGLKAADSLKTAEVLLEAGLDINQEAFREDNPEFRATPLWYAIAHGQNLKLAEFLLKRGSVPHYCMWAAAYNDDAPAIRLLVANGATEIDSSAEDATPFLFAIQWSRWAAAEQLLKFGADVNFQNSKKMTALHYLLKKGSDKKYVRLLMQYGPQGDLKNAKGITAAEIMRRKRDPEFRKMAEQLRVGRQK